MMSQGVSGVLGWNHFECFPSNTHPPNPSNRQSSRRRLGRTDVMFEWEMKELARLRKRKEPRHRVLPPTQGPL